MYQANRIVRRQSMPQCWGCGGAGRPTVKVVAVYPALDGLLRCEQLDASSPPEQQVVNIISLYTDTSRCKHAISLQQSELRVYHREGTLRSRDKCCSPDILGHQTDMIGGRGHQMSLQYTQ